jgi:hypothetical protein
MNLFGANAVSSTGKIAVGIGDSHEWRFPNRHVASVLGTSDLSS